MVSQLIDTLISHVTNVLYDGKKKRFRYNGWNWTIEPSAFGSGIQLRAEGEDIATIAAGTNAHGIAESISTIIDRRDVRPEPAPPSPPRAMPVDEYLNTVERMEPSIHPVDANAYHASAAISLKRIADTLENILIQMQIRP